MQVNWFSPLPPAHTDIAHFTGRILPALHRVARVTLWTEQDEWAPELEEYAAVERFHPDSVPWERLNRADVTVYNIGNNCEYHAAIWSVSRRHPGITILHDVRLQEMCAYWYRWIHGDREGYLRVMERTYGPEGRRDGELFWEDQLTMPYLVEHYPVTGWGAENARGMVVHTEDALETARREACGPAACVPLPYPASPRYGHGLSRDAGPPYRLIVFGYIHPNRRLESVLEALAELPVREREQFRLAIYGELWDPELIRRRIWSLAIEDLVEIQGFVPERELDEALEAAHLAINLRYPSMGEASGSQLRIWNHALPSLVTPVGMYARLPEDTVGFVRHDHEIEDLHRHWRTLQAAPEQMARLGLNGRRCLEERHTPEGYARTIVEFACTLQHRGESRSLYWTSERAADAMRPWMLTGMEPFSRRVATELLAMAGPRPDAPDVAMPGERTENHKWSR
jgi:glycosyltransferase involved in cell wall biosynthesis